MTAFRSRWLLAALLASALAGSRAIAQQPAEATAPRGSLVEDRNARKLMEAGDARYEADEIKESLEIWKSVIERYPRSKVRFEAHMRLGNYYLDKDRAYDRARAFYEAVITDENRDEAQMAEATLKVGICFYESRIFGKCFQSLRDVIEKYPVSPQVNQAYYYIGLAHFQLGHYSRAIEALERVGTALESEEGRTEKLEAGKRFFVKIDDADLAALEPGTPVEVDCEVSSGDKERVKCYPVGRNVRVVLGSIPTRLGRPRAKNGELDVKGDDVVKVHYVDSHTADKTLDRPVLKEVQIVGNANLAVVDGAFKETLFGVVLGKPLNLQVSDPDQDLTDDSDKINVTLEVWRAKSDEELEAEAAARAAEEKPAEANAKPVEDAEPEEEEEIVKLKLVDKLSITLAEAKVSRSLTSLSPTKEKEGAEGAEAKEQEAPADGEKPAEPKKSDAKVEKKPAAEEKPAAEKKAEKPAAEAGEAAATDDEAPQAPVEEDDGTIHSGVFQGTVVLAKAETADEADEALQALSGDIIRIVYEDERNLGDGPKRRTNDVRTVEGNIGGVRVTKSVISDEELRLQTKLRTAGALTNIGNRYKEFGLKTSAETKYKQALDVCDEIMGEAQKLGGSALEQTYVQLWRVYFEMDRLDLATAMCQRLQREFPTSGFVDEALLQLGDVARKQADYQRAIGIYSRLVAMETSKLRGEAQFGIAECYDAMAEATEGPGQAPLRDRAFQEYKLVFDNFADSGRVGEAVSKMANYYYQQKDYARAVDIFETVLSEHEDEKFLDVVLFNYGRCLYRMGRKTDAREKFSQLLSEFPQSPLAPDAKKISDALAKAGG